MATTLRLCSNVLTFITTLIVVTMVITYSSYHHQYSLNGSCFGTNCLVKKSKERLHHNLTEKFSDLDSPSLPFPYATLPVKELLGQKWVKDLQQVLLNLEQPHSAPVFTVTCNYNYRDVLLNWLIAAKTQLHHPLTNVIIFSVDEELWKILTIHGISCVLVDPKSFIKSELLSEGLEIFYQILILRITAIRLLNHWGFDAANIDTDAVVLKNPTSLFHRHKDSDIIASYGKFPFNFRASWGVTVCCGVLMIRSSAASEKFWEKMNRLSTNTLNDQVKINCALNTMQPDWGDTADKDILYDEWVATTPDRLKVTILPSKDVCRQTCKAEKRDQYYIWHRGGKRDTDGKIKYAIRGRLWFLKKDWESKRNSSVSGEEWLREITEQL